MRECSLSTGWGGRKFFETTREKIFDPPPWGCKKFLTHPPRWSKKFLTHRPRFSNRFLGYPFGSIREYSGPKQYMFLWEYRLEIYDCVSMTCKKCNNVIFLDRIVELARSAGNFDFFGENCRSKAVLQFKSTRAKNFWPTPLMVRKFFDPPPREV